MYPFHRPPNILKVSIRIPSAGREMVRADNENAAGIIRIDFLLTGRLGGGAVSRRFTIRDSISVALVARLKLVVNKCGM